MVKVLSGSVPRDGNRIALQAGNSFQTKDITGTPKVSPLTVSSTVITILVPLNAYQMVLAPLTADCRVSEEATAAANYFVVKASTVMTIDVSQMDKVFLLRDAAADLTLNFLFRTL